MLGNEERMLAYFKKQFSLPHEKRDISNDEICSIQIDTSLIEMLEEISNAFWEQCYHNSEYDSINLKSFNTNELYSCNQVTYKDDDTILLSFISNDYEEDINFLEVA